MPTLLLEIGCEELPAAACREAAAQLPELVRRELGGVPDHVYVSPRRLAFLLDDLPDLSEPDWVKGPPASAPSQAREGFARRHGVAVDELVERDGLVGALVPAKPLEERLGAIVRGLAFGKPMVWRAGGLRFARPVRWLLAKRDSDTVTVAVDAIPSGSVTFGHRFTHSEIEVQDAGAYLGLLRNADVEPDAAERERLIREGLDAIGGWRDPMAKLAEVVYMVESVRVIESEFDERFLQLPRRVVETAMQSHQRYFPLEGNRFAFVANGGDPAVVTAGNRQVLENRLDDADFTFDRDRRVGIEGLAGRLREITFFQGAGSFADKTERIVELVRRLGGGEASLEAARLAKADQASELVREYPDLEGHIGAEYARLAGYPEAVCAAIDEQYLPDGQDAPLPQTEAGKVLSAADKIDTLTKAFELGHKPTGSRDPYGLRRAAIGICRLADPGPGGGGLMIARELLSEDVREFVEERLESLLDVPVEFVRAAGAAFVPDLGTIAWLARALAALPDEQLGPIHTVYTRAARIVGDAGGEVDPALLAEDAEVALAGALQATDLSAVASRNPEAFAAAADLAPVVERFFEDVLVMAEDSSIRANRLALLGQVRDEVGRLGDFSQIQR
jgi:glycyl-tRNA synthetase beta chain